jgi:hypothetical protein
LKAFGDRGHDVIINAEKPRKGAFVVRVDGQEDPLVELLDMPRPFKKLRELDLDELIQKI